MFRFIPIERLNAILVITPRRRYLDITISQIDPGYVRALQRYQRVLQQRNSLLRRIQERRSQPPSSTSGTRSLHKPVRCC